MRKVSVSDSFTESMSLIYTEKLLSELRRCMHLIEAFPAMGSPAVQRSLLQKYGEGIRKLPLAPFVIVYRYDAAKDAIEFLALPHERDIA